MSLRLVIVVNDHETVRMVTRQILERVLGRSVRVLEAGSGSDAVAIRFASARPDLMIINGLMPGEMDGPGAILAIRNQERVRGEARVPIVIQSASRAFLERGMEAGADASLDTPFTTEDLIRSVSEALGA